jgi:hypothetical protein
MWDRGARGVDIGEPAAFEPALCQWMHPNKGVLETFKCRIAYRLQCSAPPLSP